MRPSNHASLKSNRRDVDNVTMGIRDMKFGAAEHPDQLIRFDEKARLFPAFSNGGIGRNLVGIDGPSWKGPKSGIGIFGQQQPFLFVENQDRGRCEGEKVMTNFGAERG